MQWLTLVLSTVATIHPLSLSATATSWAGVPGTACTQQALVSKKDAIFQIPVSYGLTAASAHRRVDKC